MRAPRKILVALGAAVLLLVVGELACRALFPAPPAAEPVAAKRPGVFRVVAVGGSTVRGLPVPELGFAAQLEELLRELAPGREVELVNFGRGARASTVVRQVVAETLARDEPDLLVVLTGHNEFLFRTGSGGIAEDARKLLRGSALFRTATKALERLRGPVVRRDSDFVLPKELVPYDRGAAWFRERRAAFAENLEAIADLARARGVPLALCTAPSNLFDWPPVHEAIAHAVPNPSYDADVARVRGELDAGDAERALADARAVEAAHGEDAMMAWLAGRALAVLGRLEDARYELRRASDLDPYPWRVLCEFNEAARRTGEREGVIPVDVARAFEVAAPDGLVGFELVCDNCHPSPLGGAVAALAIARALRERGVLLAPDVALPEPAAWRDAFLARRAAEGRLPELERRYLLENGIYCMKTPFRNRARAEVYLAQACERFPDDWSAFANRGALALLSGDRPRGVELLARAGELLGHPLDPRGEEEERAVPYLREAVVRCEVTPAELAGAR